MKKRLITILLALALALSLGVSALAYGQYGLVYELRSYMDEVFIADYESSLETMSDKYKTEIRVDISYDDSNYDPPEQVAENLRIQYAYGHPTTYRGLLLYVNLKDNYDDLGMIEWAVIGYGDPALENAADTINEYLAPYVTDEAWAGDLESDRITGENLLANYAAGADYLLSQQPAEWGWQGGEAKLSYVTDSARLLGGTDRMQLEEMAADASERYECGIYIVTVDDYRSYSTDSVYEAAKTIYRDNSLGYGAEKSGVMLLLSMADRDYSLIAYGYGNVAFTDYGKTLVEDVFLDDFRYDDWYTGFSDYISRSAEFLSDARGGSPVDVDTSERYEEPPDVAVTILIALGVGCVIAGIVCGIMALKMRSAVSAVEADEYIPAGGADLRVRQDIFTHRTETRVKIERESSGGGGTSIDSGGFSGSSGKF